MNAAILCPGPSLSRTWPPDRTYDLTVAVNRAALKGADWWACFDLPLALDVGPQLPTGRLFTRKATFDSLDRRKLPWSRVPLVLAEDIPCPVDRWDLYTTPAALVFAAHQGAKRIDVYGCDMAGMLDFDGVAAGENRSEARWEKESGIFRDVRRWLWTRGVSVERVVCLTTLTPSSPPTRPVPSPTPSSVLPSK